MKWIFLRETYQKCPVLVSSSLSFPFGSPLLSSVSSLSSLLSPVSCLLSSVSCLLTLFPLSSLLSLLSSFPLLIIAFWWTEKENSLRQLSLHECVRTCVCVCACLSLCDFTVALSFNEWFVHFACPPSRSGSVMSHFTQMERSWRQRLCRMSNKSQRCSTWLLRNGKTLIFGPFAASTLWNGESVCLCAREWEKERWWRKRFRTLSQRGARRGDWERISLWECSLTLSFYPLLHKIAYHSMNTNIHTHTVRCLWVSYARARAYWMWVAALAYPLSQPRVVCVCIW